MKTANHAFSGFAQEAASRIDRKLVYLLEKVQTLFQQQFGASLFQFDLLLIKPAMLFDFLTISAEACPGNGVQTLLVDYLVAGLATSKIHRYDPGKRLLNELKLGTLGVALPEQKLLCVRVRRSLC